MNLENLIMFSMIESGTERDLIYKRMWEAAQNGQLENFSYNTDYLIDEDIEYLEKQRLTLLKKYDII